MLKRRKRWPEREALEREPGEYCWRKGDAVRSLQFYRRARGSIDELDLDPGERNWRLAVSAAGIMTAACVEKDYVLAKRALSELKEHIESVGDEKRRAHLRSGIGTSDPRCGGLDTP